MLFEYFAENNLCLSSMLKEVENSKELVRLHIEKHGKIPEMTLTLKAAEGVQTREHKGVYHLPSSSAAVGGIVNLEPGNDPLQVIITSPKPGSNYVTRILEHSNFFYDPFQYPLLIPHGNMGYSYNLKLLQKGDKVRKYNKLTPAAFYSSMYMEREGVFNYITKCRRLFQQFVVDNYVKVETMRLDFIERNQNEIRKERSDILRGENGIDRVQRIIIPPSYVGGPRYMKQRQQDALAFVTNYGSPDFFITFTMNPAWEELEEATSQTGGNAASGCKADRPDLVSRLFKMKVYSLLDDFTVNCIFGKVKAYLYSVEWQKRGLPHVHILLWMSHNVNADFVSKIISAEIPDKETHPISYDIVTKCMIHGPCKGFDDSQLCCQGKSSSDGKNLCGKGFPKKCRDTLFFGNNGYPLYKRRAKGEDGHTFEKKIMGKNVTVDNSWVVPYSPYLCLKYNTHINVECSNSIKTIAYVTKYVNKGCDRILYTKTEKNKEIVNENEFAASLLYHEIPNFFIYDKLAAKWIETKTAALGRVRAITTKTVKLFYLRMLLSHKRGPTSYKDLRTVEGVEYEIYREAVKAMGLLNDEEMWKKTIMEIINHTNNRDQLRSTYAKLSKLELTENVRLSKTDIRNKKFAEDLLDLGKGVILECGVVVKEREELVERVYDDFDENFLNVSYFEKRAIISPTNDDVDNINEMVFNKLKENEVVYRSEDTSVDNEMDIQTSVYNALNSPSIPLHELKLKVGAVIMVLRNICPPKLCNGTRILITDLQKNIIVGKILVGAYRGEQVLLPRVTLESTDTSVIFKRRQFPVRLCYAMTINKSQGQTFECCGLLLDSAQCFAHGQLYVACSRVTSHDSLFIYTGYKKEGDDYVRKPARNYVYKELFSGEGFYKGNFEDIVEETYKKTSNDDETEVEIAEEEPDQSITVIPKSAYKISEIDAINMIMPPESNYGEEKSDSGEFIEMIQILQTSSDSEIFKTSKVLYD
ncbi:uncharacterized protein LOC143041623 [Oratosquilla oratoria]|uniref:uncharacterized protein LOC143041623 n=1 Tax=Oratosquilla oratoria TaxID=337810 RepID=UPI003F774088